jgi:hypothetical protein
MTDKPDVRKCKNEPTRFGIHELLHGQERWRTESMHITDFADSP